jgi:predicted SAM-dependent methyltransferase
MEGEHLLLDLGSGNPLEGEIQPEGYIHQDIQKFKGIDLVCDIEDLRQHIKPGTCKKIRASHICEHFPTAKIVPLFIMLYEFLEKDGELEVHVPNFKWHGALLLQDMDEEAVTYAYGSQKDKYDFHKTAFTPNIICRRLIEAGFKVKEINIEQSIHVKAIK